MRSATFGRIVGALFFAVLAGALIGWWAGREPELAGPVEQSSQNIGTNDVPLPNTRFSTNEPIAVTIPPAPPSVDSQGTPATPETETWEDRLDEILTADIETSKMGDLLLDMMPTVSADAQMELANHIVNLVEDEQYSRIGPYLTNAAVPEAISSVFMNDLYNRPDSLKLPMALTVAKTENHPLRDEARDLLELYLEEDHGSDWPKWESAMNAWLKENPDEDPEEP